MASITQDMRFRLSLIRYADQHTAEEIKHISKMGRRNEQMTYPGQRVQIDVKFFRCLFRTLPKTFLYACGMRTNRQWERVYEMFHEAIVRITNGCLTNLHLYPHSSFKNPAYLTPTIFYI